MRGGEAARLRELSAEQRELRSELEAVHSEQARRLARAHHEQQELEARLELLRQQACACEPGPQHQQEAHYAAQVQARTGLQGGAGGAGGGSRHRRAWVPIMCLYVTEDSWVIRAVYVYGRSGAPAGRPSFWLSRLVFCAPYA